MRASRLAFPASDAAALCGWFARCRRDLPWREDVPDPYRVWVSETMLQQTRIETVRDYYRRFLAAFPDIHSLAAADIQDVLRIWQGLGYYSRARSLHRAAQTVVRDLNGRLPNSDEGLRTLPGIGDYTAAAIASICHGERVPVVDGNVLRVAARRLLLNADVRTPAARARVLEWIAPRIAAAPHPGDFNQAMMELGETLCTPRSPRCPDCPWHTHCDAARSGDPAQWPRKAPKKAVPTRRAVAIVFRRGDGAVLLVRRTGARLLGEMWELPGGFLQDGESPAAALARIRGELRLPATAKLRRLGTVRHVYSHFRLELAVHASREEPDLPPGGRWVAPADIPAVPLSKAPKLALSLAGAYRPISSRSAVSDSERTPS